LRSACRPRVGCSPGQASPTASARLEQELERAGGERPGEREQRSTPPPHY